MKITITVHRKERGQGSRERETARANLALLSLFAMVDDVFMEVDAMSKAKRRTTLGRIYEEYKRCRVVLDPEFDPKHHETWLKFGAKTGLFDD